MKAPDVTVIDFETRPIMPRPEYPPIPVGFSIIDSGERKSRYYAWGHPTKNNCTKGDAQRVLKQAWRSGSLLMHHSKFDTDVAETHMGVRPITDPLLVHDTLFLLFLSDPHSYSLSLKPSAERLLNMPPTEQMAVAQWLIMHQEELRHDGLLPHGEPRITLSNFGKWICLAPGDLVGKYADGDVIRTLKLFQKLYPEIVERNMLEAYQREQKLMPILLQSEREGIQANVTKLKKDVELYNKALGDDHQEGLVDIWLRKRLKAKELNVDSDKELAQALISSGAADEDLFLLTPGGDISVSKKSLPLAVTDPRILHALQYRSMLQTRLGTFLRYWYNESQRSGGRVYQDWNQVRGDDKGARTGRISASRFMNAPVGVGTSQHDDSAMLSYRHPSFIAGLPQLPQVRIYLQPDKGDVWCKRDFAQQELRILAHFENGVLLDAYQENPEMDMHSLAVKLFKEQYDVEVSRTRTKTIGFSLLYGMGVAELAQRLQLSVAETKQLKKGYMQMFSGLKDVQDGLKDRAREGMPYRTWGGREYFVEEPKFIKKRGRVCTFEYKMLNYLIQGSAADVTKQALINYAEIRKDGKFRITVHDEFNLSVPRAHVKSEMKILREAMSDIQLDCMLLSDGSTGPNWAELKDFKEPSFKSLLKA